LIQTRSQLEKERNEREAVARQLKDLRDDARRRIDALERRNQELEADNDSLLAQVKNTDGKRNKTQDLEERVRVLENERKKAEVALNNAEAQLSKVQDLKIEAERRNETLRREIDMLT